MKINQNNSVKRIRITLWQKKMVFLFFVLMIPLFFISRNIIVGFTQTTDKNEKRITKEVFKNEPIEILEIKSDEKAVRLKENFAQKDDWLKDFTLKFRNVSGKSIVYVSTVIGFPETESTGYGMVYPLKFGINPLVKKSKGQPKLLKSNDIGEIVLTAENYLNLKNFLATRSHSLNDLTEIHLTILVVYFDDGTQWGAGTTFRPDPNIPDKFIPVDQNNQEEEK